MAIHSRRASLERTRSFTPCAYAIARYKLVDCLQRSRARASAFVDDCEASFASDGAEQAAASRGSVAAATKVSPHRELLRLSKLPAEELDADG